MKKLGRSVVLALLLAGTGGAIAQSTSTPVSNTQTGTDPVPTPPPSPPSVVTTMLIVWFGIVL